MAAQRVTVSTNDTDPYFSGTTNFSALGPIPRQKVPRISVKNNRKHEFLFSIEGVSCYFPDFTPWTGLDTLEAINATKGPESNNPISEAVLDATAEMFKLALRYNCRICDMTIWGSDPSILEQKNGNVQPDEASWALWEASCAAGRLGRGTSKENGACFSNKAGKTTPMPGLPDDDCRQCPGECSTCVLEVPKGWVKNGKAVNARRFKCVMASRPNSLKQPIPGYACKPAKPRRSAKFQYKTRCLFPQYARSKMPNYFHFWPSKERNLRQVGLEKASLDLGNVDCISAAPSKQSLAERFTKEFAFLHASTAMAMYAAAVYKNVERCSLVFTSEKGQIQGGWAKDAILEEGTTACSSRNGPLLTGKHVDNACKKGDKHCCSPCPHECEKCVLGRDGKTFQCTLRKTSQAFSQRLPRFISPAHHKDAVPGVRGFDCSAGKQTGLEKQVDLLCSLDPVGGIYPVLPLAKDSLPAAAEQRLQELEMERAQIIMGIYDGPTGPVMSVPGMVRNGPPLPDPGDPGSGDSGEPGEPGPGDSGEPAPAPSPPRRNKGRHQPASTASEATDPTEDSEQLAAEIKESRDKRRERRRKKWRESESEKLESNKNPVPPGSKSSKATSLQRASKANLPKRGTRTKAAAKTKGGSSNRPKMNMDLKAALKQGVDLKKTEAPPDRRKLTMNFQTALKQGMKALKKASVNPPPKQKPVAPSLQNKIAAVLLKRRTGLKTDEDDEQQLKCTAEVCKALRSPDEWEPDKQECDWCPDHDKYAKCCETCCKASKVPDDLDEVM